MPKIQKSRTNFTAGHIGPALYGRSDLKAYQNGMRTIENMVLHPTGGVSRRPGLHLAAQYQEKDQFRHGRILPFMFNAEQIYLLIFLPGIIDVYWQDRLLLRIKGTPYQKEHLAELRTAMSADMMLIVHKDLPPKQLLRMGEKNWKLQDWSFYDQDNRLYQPYFKFAADTATLQPSATSGTITLTANQDVFSVHHIGVHFRVQNREIIIKSVTNARKASATTRENLVNIKASQDWQEAAFSTMRGFPNSVCFHQDRLCIGGSRDLPNRVWGSKSVDFFNFDLGEGLDDEALEVSLLADQVNRIETIFSSQELQIFTSGAEWVIDGQPLTPSDMMLLRKTRNGTKSGAYVAPCFIEGGTIFAAKGNGGNIIAEFLYADDDQAYLATDLTVMAKGLITNPIDQDYDRFRRRLMVVLENGDMAVLTIFRAENIFGWTKFSTQGKFLSIVALEDKIYVLVERENAITLEYFDEGLYQDQAIIQHHSNAVRDLSGLDTYDGQKVQIVNQGHYLMTGFIDQGKIELDQERAGDFTIGLAYEARLEPLPLSLEGRSISPYLQAVRLIRIVLRLHETQGLELDVGQGFIPLVSDKMDKANFNAPPFIFSGEVERRALGWKKEEDILLWRVRSPLPQPCTILALTQEIAVI